MIPLRDHNPSGRTPWITHFLMGINIVVFLGTFMLTTEMMTDFWNNYALVPQRIINGERWISFLTSLFLHASWGHLFGNMLFLHIFGDNLEAYLGRFWFLLMYLLAGFGGSLAQLLLEPTSLVPMLGASGAIAGLMGGYLLLFPQNRIDLLLTWGFLARQVSVPAYSMLAYWFLGQVFYGFGSLGMSGGVAYFAHIGGFIVGVIFVSLFRKFSGRQRVFRMSSGFDRFDRQSFGDWF